MIRLPLRESARQRREGSEGAIRVREEERVAPASRPPTRRGRRAAASPCEGGHWIESVSGDGEIVKLEDGSVWQVDATDTLYSTLWLPTTEIVVCDDRLINTDDNEKVQATRIK